MSAASQKAPAATPPAAPSVAAAAAPVEIELEAATIARGRTLKIGKDYKGPGTIVHLPADEVSRLRRSGFLVDPAATEILVDSGPTFVKPVGQPEPRRVILA